jgi:hypothetical protein
MTNYKFTILLMVFIGALLVTATSHAQTYKWTDEHGNVGLTDDISTIPEKYRESATQLGPPEEPREDQSTQPAHPDLVTDLMERMTMKFPGISYSWDQGRTLKDTLTVWMPNSLGSKQKEFSEIAAQIATYYRRQKGYGICVRLYYGNGKFLVECR